MTASEEDGEVEEGEEDKWGKKIKVRSVEGKGRKE